MKRNLNGASSSKLKAKNILMIFALCLLVTGILNADNNTENIENTRATIEKWVETQRVISKEKHDLALAKEMLNERISLVEREIESLKGKITEAEKSIDEADKKRSEMLKENERFKNASDSLGSSLLSLESGTKAMLTRLPGPIRDRVKPLSQRLPENPEAEDIKLSTAERFQNVIGILNEVDKFNREITVTSEVRELEDSSVEVAALYVGIGQAYYANSDRTIAGVGSTSDDGWVWERNIDSAAQISDAISILNNEKVASFVQVPVEIK